MPTLHGPRKRHASKFARRDRGQRTVKEDPSVAAFPGTGTFQGSRTFNSWQASRKAKESYSHVALSKSAARNQHVSLGRSG